VGVAVAGRADVRRADVRRVDVRRWQRRVVAAAGSGGYWRVTRRSSSMDRLVECRDEGARANGQGARANG